MLGFRFQRVRRERTIPDLGGGGYGSPLPVVGGMAGNTPHHPSKNRGTGTGYGLIYSLLSYMGIWHIWPKILQFSHSPYVVVLSVIYVEVRRPPNRLFGRKDFLALE